MRFKQEVSGRNVWVDDNGDLWNAASGGQRVTTPAVAPVPKPLADQIPLAVANAPDLQGLPATKADLIRKPDVSPGMTVHGLIETALRRRKYIAWSAMHEVMFGGAFQNFRIGQMINAAEEEVAGADALLVDNNVQFSANAPAEIHFAWLKERGYVRFPRVRAQ